jgi:hypothetical protein
MCELRERVNFGHFFSSEGGGSHGVRRKGFTLMGRSGRRPARGCGGGMSLSKTAFAGFRASLSARKLRPDFHANLSATPAVRGERDEPRGQRECREHTANATVDRCSSRGLEVGEKSDASARASAGGGVRGASQDEAIAHPSAEALSTGATLCRSSREARGAHARLATMVIRREVTSPRARVFVRGQRQRPSPLEAVQVAGSTTCSMGRRRRCFVPHGSPRLRFSPHIGAEIFAARSHASSATAATPTARGERDGSA